MFDETEEWLLGCPEMIGKTGFFETGEVWEKKSVLWNARSLIVSDRVLPYDQIKLALVGTVGTHVEDATQTSSPVLIVQEWDALHKNHPGFQNSGIEEWLGIFVHEAFHARQMWHPRVQKTVTRWSRENPPATADELAGFYQKNEEFRAALTKEMEVLVAFTNDPSATRDKARAALAQWLALYHARKKTFASAMDAALPKKDAWLMDSFVTFLEGSARYVEAKFLMSPSKISFEALAREPTFTRFERTAGKKPSELAGLGKLGSKYFYALGMHLCFVLDQADPSWKAKVFDSDDLLIGQVERIATSAGR